MTDRLKRITLDERLDATRKIAISDGIHVGVRMLKESAAKAFIDGRDAEARLLLGLAYQLEEFVDEDGLGAAYALIQNG